jgi:hypothetical protein
MIKNTDRYQSKWRKTNTRENRNFFENIYFFKQKKRNELDRARPNCGGWACATGLDSAQPRGLMIRPVATMG